MKRALSHARVSREGREREKERESGSPGNLISLQGWDQAGKAGVDSTVMIWVTDSAAIHSPCQEWGKGGGGGRHGPRRSCLPQA